MERIYMDEFHYESYDNIKEALDSWSERTAQEQMEINAALDYDIGVEMDGLSDILMFDEKKLMEYIGTEDMGIKDKVKNMASRVKSNLTLWIKKFINFFFGWIVNFFKGVVNIRKSLKAGFDKAKAYLKKMNEMSAKMGGDFKNGEGEEKTVKVSNSSPLLIQCLSTVLVSSYLLEKLGPLLTNIKDQADQADKVDATNKNGQQNGQEIKKSAVNTIIYNLTVGIVAIGSVATVCDPRKGDFYINFKNQKYDIAGWAGSANNGLQAALKKRYTDQGLVDRIWNWIQTVLHMKKDNNNNTPNFMGASKGKGNADEDLKDISNQIRSALGESAKGLEAPEPEEVPYKKAFMMIKESLSSFVNIAIANKDLWNFEKVAEAFEKVRRKLLAYVDKYNPTNEDEGKELFNKIANIGTLMSAVSSNANKCMQNVNKFLDTVITDASRLGAAITSTTGKN